MSIVDHPAWQRFGGYFRVEVYDRDGGHYHPRVRLEVDVPPALHRAAMEVRVPCVACGAAIAPFRTRQSTRVSKVYYAPTCPLSVNVGCSRGSAARDEYTRVRKALGVLLPDEGGRPTTQTKPAQGALWK
jgi:hypothetical protein